MQILTKFLPLKHLVLGLAIYNDALTLMYVSRSAATWRLQYCAHYPFTDLPDLATLHHHIQPQQRWYDMQAAIAVPHNLVMKTYVTLPAYLSEDVLAQEIKASLNSYFPEYAAEDLYYDFVCESTDHDVHKLAVFALAKQDVASRMAVAAQLGLAVQIIDVDIYAINRAATWYLKRHYPHITTALLIELQQQDGYVLVWQAGVCVWHYSWQQHNDPLVAVQQAVALWQASQQEVCPEILGLSGVGDYYQDLVAIVSTTLACNITTYCLVATAGMGALAEVPQATQAHGLLLCTGLALRNTGM